MKITECTNYALPIVSSETNHESVNCQLVGEKRCVTTQITAAEDYVSACHARKTSGTERDLFHSDEPMTNPDK